MNKMNRRCSRLIGRFCLSTYSPFYKIYVSHSFADVILLIKSMKFIKNLFILALTFTATQTVHAQSSALKDPVSFKLKNGLTVIVAENHSSSKVFSSFNSEAEVASEKAGAKEILTAMLNANAGQLAKQLSFTEKGGNINALASDFDWSLQALSASIQQPLEDQKLFESCKAALSKSVEARDRYYAPELNVEAVADLTLNDIQHLHHELMVPGSTYLTIAGNISLADAKVLAKKSFGTWKGTESTEISK